MEHTTGQALEFIERSFGVPKLSNKGLNASVVCPLCSQKEDNLQKRKLVIRTDDFLTHCWVCGYRATNLLHLLREFHPHLVQEYQKVFKIRPKVIKDFDLDLEKLFEEEQGASKPLAPLSLPAGFTLLATNLRKGDNLVEGAWKYLRSRGFTEADLWYWKVGITDHKPTSQEEVSYRFRVIFPSFDTDGNLNYFSARAWWAKLQGPKYSAPNRPRESLIFNEINIDWSKELTLVEGVFDLAKCNQNATCLLGSTLDETYFLFKQIVKHNTPVLLALDNDAKHKTMKLIKLFLEYGITVRILDVPSNFNDVGQMTKAEFETQRQKAQVVSTEDLLFYELSRTA